MGSSWNNPMVNSPSAAAAIPHVNMCMDIKQEYFIKTMTGVASRCHWTVFMLFYFAKETPFLTFSWNPAWQSNSINTGSCNGLLPQGTKSTLAHVMTCCLVAPRHYLIQCWLLICEFLWQSPESNVTVTALATILYHEVGNYTCKKLSHFPRGQWVRCPLH